MNGEEIRKGLEILQDAIKNDRIHKKQFIIGENELIATLNALHKAVEYDKFIVKMKELDAFSPEAENLEMLAEHYENVVQEFCRLEDLEDTTDEMQIYIDELVEKNKKLEALSNNLAKAIKFMGTNSELTVEEICKIFSPEEIKIDFDDFMKHWENEQHKKADLKDKVINLMAVDYMNNHISGEYSDTPCEYYKEIEKKEKCQEIMWDDVCFGDCKECLIQYYFKKANEIK